jgi:hypothetical protein
MGAKEQNLDHFHHSSNPNVDGTTGYTAGVMPSLFPNSVVADLTLPAQSQLNHMAGLTSDMTTTGALAIESFEIKGRR